MKCDECGAPEWSPTFSEYMAIAKVLWKRGWHQEQCPHCRRYTVWVEGAPDGMWALGAMSRLAEGADSVSLAL